ncbi:sensor histidine kinase [Paenibacillus yanchengensis]|uniref:Heme sensor protein HssS n=1 Tax=Paenibacillus yanchengensis TaxID=2035833 RepID=A0ABW4YNA6_9BACL
MKTLYTRVVLTFIFISLISSFFALFATDFYYQNQLMNKNEQKVLDISKEIRDLYNKIPNMDVDVYLSHIANMGFQIYAVNEQLEGRFYGGSFKDTEIKLEQIKRVLRGEIYNGILLEQGMFIINFFENSIHNSIGIPLEVDGNTIALFIRPNMKQQIGEIRVYMALLLILTFVSSVVLIIILSSYIVKPIKNLTKATNQIIKGNYDIKLNVLSQDEIGDLAKHFTKMANSIKQLDDMRQEFVANVSHEIQTPLTSIQGFSQSIIDKEVGPEETEYYLQIINEQSRRLSLLSKQLLTLATLEKEENLIKRRSFRLDEQLREVLIATEWHWTEKQLVIDLDLPEVVITGDKYFLYQVWFNLITNCIKFSHVGGHIQIEIIIDRDIVVEITDNGIGIGELELPHVFDRFYKADKSRNVARSGSGLGLSIVKKIIGLHKGTVEVRSVLGKGTTFQVKLPN